jgi:hypothetical protein
MLVVECGSLMARNLCGLPGRRCSSRFRKGCKLKVYSVILRGHPCPSPQRILIGPCRFPLICTADVASVYRDLICFIRRPLKPYLLRMEYN